MTFDKSKLKYDVNGLIPTVVQDEKTGKVLMLAYMNEESLNKTIETKQTWFYSRSRQELWNKGATSGNTQQVVRISYDCDGDTLLVQVTPAGPACHTGAETCFNETIIEEKTDTRNVIHQLVANIKDRKENPVEGAYTTYLFEKGIDKILKKIGEESAEVIIGAKNNDKQEVTWEVSDLIYHTLVLMELLGVSLEDLKEELHRRHIEKQGESNE
ncbi:bifunctional phosphoribosyl-AMP cyclohydrolase/phosphoribosyl-ATP diphosphatase HisIE [Aciduricibacillus chroicocephali]|uniref:Histidine biosynthesis bifunctional protein HisIE n=1 Tax=Aciduricibacillus chroicocephali TaxID=3054939 RepID=A0ABY9KWF4_9BACI|nr:bifunctional phosphoribosyl-AMP cyclohydrolase/phosphoribosyl-ATP diphosphatase HisIE [Bacillaceae bacterium 44XB]